MDWSQHPNVIEAHARAQRMVRLARRAGNRQPNLFESYLLLYEIGQRNGWPVNQITGAIVTAGYSAGSAAYSLGTSIVSAIQSRCVISDFSQ